MTTYPAAVLLTGATGLVGSALLAQLSGHCRVFSLGRSKPVLCEAHVTAAFGDNTDWLEPAQQLLAQTDVVVHCAAKVHVMRDAANDPLAAYCAVNTDATLLLAQAAAKAGVKRFVFISTIKVNGEYTEAGRPFTASDTVAPTDPYAVSKWRAEQALLLLGQQTGMEIVIIRPPMVYGVGVKANFLALCNAVRRGLPMPFAGINNKRSMVSVANLTSLIICCLTHPAAPGRVWLASDAADLSSAELVRLMAQAMNVPARVWWVPTWLMHAAATVLGKGEQYRRIAGSLQLDINDTCQQLGWQPQQTPQQALQQLLKKPASGG